MFRKWPEGASLLHSFENKAPTAHIHWSISRQTVALLSSTYPKSSSHVAQMTYSKGAVVVQGPLGNPSLQYWEAVQQYHCTILGVCCTFSPALSHSREARPLGPMVWKSFPGTPTFCLPTHWALWFVGYTSCGSLTQEDFGMQFVGTRRLSIPELRGPWSQLRAAYSQPVMLLKINTSKTKP